jgi:hypothetical protein
MSKYQLPVIYIDNITYFDWAYFKQGSKILSYCENTVKKRSNWFPISNAEYHFDWCYTDHLFELLFQFSTTYLNLH